MELVFSSTGTGSGGRQKRGWFIRNVYLLRRFEVKVKGKHDFVIDEKYVKQMAMFNIEYAKTLTAYGMQDLLK